MLATGTRLGPYEILGLIGEGGMGQVYRAADTRLDRAVAIKVLPASLADDPIRRERFEREARSISKLEHPNICPLYDVGELPPDPDSPSLPGGLFLVMQLLEGESLAQRLEKGPLSIAQTLEFGIQIADALAAAHRSNIVHRDLKPANVMLTRTGARLLDFGLARSVSVSTPSGKTMANSGVDRTSLTTQGTLLGTLHYMAPEQLDGREVDTRADIFAFGAVLFEMITGMKAFDGESPARVMSSILRDEPTRVASLVPVTPAGLDELIHTCLAKDPDDRWQGLSDVSRQLRWLQSSLSAGRSGAAKLPSGVIAARPSASRSRWIALGVAAAVAIAAIGGLIGARWFGGAAPASASSLRLHAYLLPPEGNYLAGGLALSPDGKRLAFVAADASGARQLWIRALDTPRAQPVTGTTGASDPFWSPAGDEVAFFASNQLKRVPAGGGSAAVICDTGVGAGGTWSRDGTIVFQPYQQGHLMRVAATGGRPEPETVLDAAKNETHHLYPTFLPDGRHFVFYVAGAERGLHAASLDSKDREFLFDPDPSLPTGAAATPGVYSESGHLLYVRDRVLMARPFDGSLRRATGEAVKLVDTVDYDPSGEAAFAVSGPFLVYRPRPDLPVATLSWVDRAGKPLATLAAPPGSFRQLSLDPSGRRLAVDRRDAQGVSSVWLIDLDPAKPTSTRVPTAYWSGAPLWSADGRQLIYSIAADSPPNLAIRDQSGAGSERRLTRAASIQYASDWTPDGRTILFRGFSNDTGWDLFTVPVDADAGPPQRLLQTRANENDARLSPDGRTMVYTSDESGRVEVYLTRFPEAQGSRALSSGGGARPMWRRDGREVYYIAPDNRVMAVAISAGSALPSAGSPTVLFQVPLFSGLYAPSADGQRFLIATPTASTDIVAMEVVVNALAK
jgi:eukaryotic-like serine/threonine-protein kinase